MEKDVNQKLQEIQMLEQTLQSLLFQKQAFQMEISETKSASKEIENSDEVFKIIGQLMMKTDPKKVKQDLASKEKLLDLRMKSLEKQESELVERLEKIRKEISQ